MVSIKTINDVISLPVPMWRRSKAMRLRNMYSVLSSNFKVGNLRTPRLKEKSLRLFVLLFLKLIPASWSAIADRMKWSLSCASKHNQSLFVDLGLGVGWLGSSCITLFLYTSNTCMHFPKLPIKSMLGFNKFMIFLFNSCWSSCNVSYNYNFRIINQHLSIAIYIYIYINKHVK